jgi:hypothetical protein
MKNHSTTTQSNPHESVQSPHHPKMDGVGKRTVGRLFREIKKINKKNHPPPKCQNKY